MTEPQIVSYQLDDKIAIITMNDGDKNLMSPTMLDAVNSALDKAKKEATVVIITGHAEILSAGFDLKILKSGAGQTFKMLNDGFALTTRLLSFKTPVVIACPGHAIAMGAFILLSGDYRIGTTGPYKIMANEVAIGLTMPATAIEVCKQRLTPAHFVRAVTQSEEYNPASAVEAGFLDRVVAPEQLLEEAKKEALRLSTLDTNAYYQTKLRVRRHVIKALKRANRFDKFDIIRLGVNRMFKKKKK